jgi:hypothetical protein
LRETIHRAMKAVKKPAKISSRKVVVMVAGEL